MIESVENAAQLALVLGCAGVCAAKALRSRSREWLMLTLFYGSFALGDGYWLLYLMFYGQTPRLFYASDLCWYAAYLYLYLLLQRVSTSEERSARYYSLLPLPLFAGGMAAFYLRWGDWAGNLISAVLMSLLMWHAVRGLKWLRGRPEEGSRRGLYIAVLVFCAIEYAAWTASCFWMGDTWMNPYFWFDSLLTLSLACFLPAAGRAVAA